MSLETATYINQLDAANPLGSDPIAAGDDHLRLIKSTLKATFPNITGAVTKTHTDINNLATQSDLSTLQSTLTAAIATAVSDTKNALYPVGSIYTNATDNTNPGTLLGFGTWSAFGAGRVPVGFDATNSNFNTAEKTGGSADAVVVSHSHTFSGTTGGQSNSHSHPLQTSGGGSADPFVGLLRRNLSDGYSFGTSGNVVGDASADHSHNYSGATSTVGSSATNANLQPYITVYMWKRTA